MLMLFPRLFLMLALTFISPSVFARGQCTELFKKLTASTDYIHSFYSAMDTELMTAVFQTPRYQATVNELQQIRKYKDSPKYTGKKTAARDRSLLVGALSALKEKRKDQALVIYNGAYHSQLIFEQLGPQKNIIYLTPRQAEEARLPLVQKLRDTFPDPSALSALDKQVIEMILREALTLLGHHGKKYLKDVQLYLKGKEGDTALGDHVDILARAFHDLKEVYKPGEELIAVSPDVFIINDIHYFNSTAFLEQMPPLSQLQSQGLREILVLVEGVPGGRSVDLEHFIKNYGWSDKSLLDVALHRLPKKERQTIDAYLEMTPNLRTFANEFNAPLSLNPIMDHMLVLLRDRYAKYGIKVRVRGLEDH